MVLLSNHIITYLFVIIIIILTYVNGLICPETCSCYLDGKGRRTLSCQEGGMTGPLTLHDVERKIEVLKISAPENNMNLLTMSPNIQAFTKLEEIHITRSNIPILGQNFFYDLHKLEILNLSQNNITQPLDHNFRGLDKLKELYLDDNRIISLPSATFRYLKDLRVLSIQRNRINGLMPRMFIELSKLRVLKLSGNNIGHLPAEIFADIKDLEVLECRACSLRDVQNDIYVNLHQLNQLDLGDNLIDIINVDDFKLLNKLKCLKLDGNRIETILDGAFIKQNEMKILNLSRNILTKLYRKSFVNLSNLTVLNLSYNQLNDIDTDVFDVINNNLEILILSGNRLNYDNLKSILKITGSHLLNLQLADIGLTTLKYDFIPNNVMTLNLAGNHLTYLPTTSLPYNLTDLDISRNHFRGFNEETVQRLLTLSRINLDNNPWSCDLCHIVPLLERVNISSVIHDIKCATPYNQEGRILGTVQNKQLNWCSTPSFTSSDANLFLNDDDGRIGIIAASASLILLILTIIAILGALCYSKRHAANYYTNEDKRVTNECDAIVENNSPLFGEDHELSFKFPLSDINNDKKIAIATIDELKKDHNLSNGT